MNKASKGTKTAGKIFAAITLILLIVVAAASWYIGGQTKAIEKLCTAIASADYKDFSKIYSSEKFVVTEEDFMTSVGELCNFPEKGAADVISSDVKINYHRYSDGKWLCSADIDFYCSGSNIDCDDTVFEMTFSGGRWTVEGIYQE